MSDGILDPKPSPQVAAAAYALWLLTAALSAIMFLAGREMIIRTYLRFFPWDSWRLQAGQGGLSLVNVLVSLPLASLVILIVIGGFEYQHHKMGQPRAWQMRARTLAVELGILLLVWYV